MTMALTRQRQEPWARDTRRRSDDEIPHGIHQQHKTIRGLTWQSTTHRSGRRRTTMIPNRRCPPFLIFPLFSFPFFSSHFSFLFFFSLLPPHSLSYPFSYLTYHILMYHTISHSTLPYYLIHCAHVTLEPPQEATTVGVRLKHGHYSYT